MNTECHKEDGSKANLIEHPSIELLEKLANGCYFPEWKDIQSHVQSCSECWLFVCVAESSTTGYS